MEGGGGGEQGETRDTRGETGGEGAAKGGGCHEGGEGGEGGGGGGQALRHQLGLHVRTSRKISVSDSFGGSLTDFEPAGMWKRRAGVRLRGMEATQQME